MHGQPNIKIKAWLFIRGYILCLRANWKRFNRQYYRMCKKQYTACSTSEVIYVRQDYLM
jgi:hypothetical protein